MIHVALPEKTIAAGYRRACFYLAMEEVVGRRYAPATPEGLFFLWRIPPTVVCGRHQWIDTEVNLDYCERNGIDVCRRRSGGGAIFANTDNIMFSYIIPGDEVMSTFELYTDAVVGFLKSLGLDASATTRNDILIGDRKVSGTAFYHIPAGVCIVHGTMLYKTDPVHMANALTPSRAKLESKGVKSVVSRITTIAEHLPDISIEEFRQAAIDSLCRTSITLTDDDIKEIERLATLYDAPSWKQPRRNRGASRSTRLEGIGEFSAEVTLDPHGAIESVAITGDFLPTGDVNTLTDRLKGLIPTSANIEAALGNNVTDIIPRLTAGQLTRIITENIPTP